MKEFTNKQMEWFILFCITGVIGMKAFVQAESYLLIDITTSTRLLYLSVFMILLCLIGAAKCGLFNIFKVIRQTPSFLIVNTIAFYLQSKREYKNWKHHGDRNDRK